MHMRYVTIILTHTPMPKLENSKIGQQCFVVDVVNHTTEKKTLINIKLH